ncbi:hypothetical protein [Lacticaseibacillus sp. GG6-2]
MIPESRQLLANYDKYFLRKYHWQYHLLIVNNHFFDCYSFFMQAHRTGDALHYSYDLLEMPRDAAKYQQVMTDLASHSKMRIEFRDTHQLYTPEPLITHDLVHGHGKSPRYHAGRVVKPH